MRCQSVEIDANPLGVGEIEHKGSVKKMALSVKLLSLLRYKQKITVLTIHYLQFNQRFIRIAFLTNPKMERKKITQAVANSVETNFKSFMSYFDDLPSTCSEVGDVARRALIGFGVGAAIGAPAGAIVSLIGVVTSVIIIADPVTLLIFLSIILGVGAAVGLVIGGCVGAHEMLQDGEIDDPILPQSILNLR